MKESFISFKNSLPKKVLLLAVSKTKSKEEILDLYQLGQRAFGENKVQELVDKYESLPKDINWHLIGHLQANKVKYIAPFVQLIHSVDSKKLADEINKQAEKYNRTIAILLQIKIAEEESKFGLHWEDALELYNYSQQLKNIKIVGLMGIATNTEDKKKVKQEFRQLSTRFKHLQEKDNEITILSMGMSQDYPIAIEEGSNLIRIGSLLFGERN